MIELNKKIQAQFEKMCATGKLFTSSVDGNLLWNTYLEGFGKDEIFRDPNSSLHNCKLCNNFIRRYGNIVAVDNDLRIMTLFDINVEGEYSISMKMMSNLLKNNKIDNVFFESFQELKELPYESCKKDQSVFKLGIDKNVKRYTKEEAELFGVVKPNEIVTFNHFMISIPKQFVDMSSMSIPSIYGNYKSDKEVFERGLEEIPLETLKLVRDLIMQGSLLDGNAHLSKLDCFIPFKESYDKLFLDKQYSLKNDNWFWVNSYKFTFAKFKNTLIGVLCSEIASGIELNTACLNWNKRVDPINYMKAVAPITRKQIAEAQKFVEENGYIDSFNRRCATLEDIKVSNILHINSNINKKLSIFDNVKSNKTTSKFNFDKIEEVSIEKFMSEILPNCTSIEAFLSSNHENNLVTLTTSNVEDSKPIFKWPNNYSWTYNGNLAGKSQITKAVKAAGGFVDAPFRFSIMWNEDGRSRVDFDAHAIEPDKTEIYYGTYKGNKTRMSGSLDIDMIRPQGVGVENIFWTDLNKLSDGTYKFFVHNYDSGSNNGFKAEIAFKDQLFTYNISTNVLGTEQIAKVVIKNGEISDIIHIIKPESSSAKSINIYGLDTNEFHKVNLVCLSPNHWENSIGNKHYFFMLNGCKNPEKMRSFHNENLISSLNDYRKVMEVLANTTMVESSDNQLSGLGFNATVRDELVVKLQGTFNRIIKIKF